MTSELWISAAFVAAPNDGHSSPAQRSSLCEGIVSAPNGVTSAVEGPDWTWPQGTDSGMTQEARTLFAKRLREARQARGLTQVDLAKLTGIAQPDISLIERANANVTLDTMERLATAVDKPLHTLLTP